MNCKLHLKTLTALSISLSNSLSANTVLAGIDSVQVSLPDSEEMHNGRLYVVERWGHSQLNNIIR